MANLSDHPSQRPNPSKSIAKTENRRRQILKSLALGGGTMVGLTHLPGRWVKPVIEAVVIPAHAQTSTTTTTATPTTTATATTTSAPTTTTTTVAPTTTCVPGELTLTYSTDTELLFSTTQIVTYTYEVENTGPVTVTSYTLDDPDASNITPPVSGPIAPGETHTYTSSRTWTWNQGENIITEATLTYLDGCGGEGSSTQTLSIPTVGINMAIYTNQKSIQPGDKIRIRLVSRLYASGVDDAQWVGLQYRCNLLDNNQWRKGGPRDRIWADPSNDFINPRKGARKVALDLNEGQDHGNRPDWIHEFTYQVPENLTTDLVITAEDAGSIRFFNDRQWSPDTPLKNGFDRIVLPLNPKKS